LPNSPNSFRNPSHRDARIGPARLTRLDTVECIVVGAGVIGLAVARALAMAGRETLIVERQPTIGTQNSSRNSEVVHAGIYYPAGSRKARFCVRGRDLLYEFCATHAVSHRQCGKLIVAASDEQAGELPQIVARANANGVHDIRGLSRTEATALEPELQCVAALLSPATGIIDGHGYMTALLGVAEQHGATLATHSEVAKLRRRTGGVDVQMSGSEGTWRAKWLINAAGLDALPLVRAMEGFPQQQLPCGYFAKGSYFSVSQRAPFSHLIYPLPESAGLGIHLTLDLAGRARCGPDVEWVNSIDFAVDGNRGNAFYAAIRRYWPALQDGALAPAYAGIRPKLSGPGEPDADFRIDGPAEHGVDGVINLFGIESPGLTASLAIAEYVAAIVDGAA
jgi:L-2-hydroxyglutarate oxidase LhgO